KTLYPDTVIGTDSHTTMINGLGVLGWGVGGIEAEAAMLGQPVSMLIPQVVGVKLHGQLPEGATATDLVLTVTQLLRKKGVVGKFVEFDGEGIAALGLAVERGIGEGIPEVQPHQPPPGPTIDDVGGPAHDEVAERHARKVHHGSVVIAAITSCTNTSNPSVMLAAGLVAKKAVERGL